MDPDNTAVAIAVLRERTEVLGREMRELKDAQRAQMLEMRQAQQELNKKMDAVLTAMSEARGGWKTLMLVGGMAASIGAVLAWCADHFARAT